MNNLKVFDVKLSVELKYNHKNKIFFAQFRKILLKKNQEIKKYDTRQLKTTHFTVW